MARENVRMRWHAQSAAHKMQALRVAQSHMELNQSTLHCDLASDGFESLRVP